MLEINPVLAGTFDAPGYAPAASNINRPPAEDAAQTAGIDPRRYTQFDRSAAKVAEINDFSFDDLLDIVNPLQHLPVLSSIYRAITDDEIRPFARVAGDVLYGGLMGGISAVTSGIGAVAESAVAEETGKDFGEIAIAALFGTDDAEETTKLAAAGQAAPDEATVAVEPAEKKIVLADAGPVIASAPGTQPGPDSTAAAEAGAAQGTIPLVAAKAFPLKRPFGGAMAPPNPQAQNMAIALSAAAPGMRLGHTIYTGGLMNGPHPLPLKAAPVAPTVSDVAPVPDAAPVAPVGTQNSLAGPQKNSLPDALVQDMMLKALNQYRGIAGGSSALGGIVNLTN